eukprot:m.88392 g.88392  ORF g.88392 m.88392 type:complete len:340 (+) comp16430_c0_seq8:271-1290(+)
MDNLNAILAGGGAGAVSTILCSPFDVAKTRQQVMGMSAVHARPHHSVSRSPSVSGKSATGKVLSKGGTRRGVHMAIHQHVPPSNSLRGIWHSLRSIVQAEGAAALYSGLAPGLITVPMFWASYFPVYEAIKQRFSHDESLGMTRAPAWAIHAGSSVLAGGMADVLTNPLWVIRTRLQTNALRGEASGCSSMVAEARRMYAAEGGRAFFKGLKATLLGLSHTALQFPIYEHIKQQWRDDDGSLSTVNLMGASAISKVAASTATYPHEVIRARMQYTRTDIGERMPTLTGTFRAVIAQSGVRGLYAGLALNLVRVVPSCVATFLTYEYLMGVLAASRTDIA